MTDPLGDAKAELDYGLTGEDVQKASNPAPGLSLEFRVEDHNDFWRVHGVQRHDGIYTVDLLKVYLDNDIHRSRAEWALYSYRHLNRGDFGVPSLPLIVEFLDALDKNKSGQYSQRISTIRDYFDNLIEDGGTSTLSRIEYGAGGAMFIHDYLQKGEYSYSEKFPELGGRLTEMPAALCRALTGCADGAKVDRLLSWATNSTISVSSFGRHDCKEQFVALTNLEAEDQNPRTLVVWVDYEDGEDAFVSIGMRWNKTSPEATK